MHWHNPHITLAWFACFTYCTLALHISRFLMCIPGTMVVALLSSYYRRRTGVYEESWTAVGGLTVRWCAHCSNLRSPFCCSFLLCVRVSSDALKTSRSRSPPRRQSSQTRRTTVGGNGARRSIRSFSHDSDPGQRRSSDLYGTVLRAGVGGLAMHSGTEWAGDRGRRSIGNGNARKASSRDGEHLRFSVIREKNRMHNSRDSVWCNDRKPLSSFRENE